MGGEGGGEVREGAVMAGGEEAEPSDDEDEKALEPGEGELDVGGLERGDDVEGGHGPGDDDGNHLRPGDAA